MVKIYKRNITREEHEQDHVSNFVLVVGCPYCQPDINRNKDKKYRDRPI